MVRRTSRRRRVGSSHVFQDFFSFPTWEDGFLTIAVAIFLMLAGGALLLAWLKRRRD